MDSGLVVVVTAGLAVTGLVIVAAMNRVIRNSRTTGGTFDALGNFFDVFAPAESRSARILKERKDAGTVTPVPDDDERRGPLVVGPDGRPKAIRLTSAPPRSQGHRRHRS